MSLVVSSVDASCELAFVRNFACLHARNDVLMNLNAFAGVNACSSALRTNERWLSRVQLTRMEKSRPLPSAILSRKARSVTTTRSWCTTRVSPPNFAAARAAALKQFVVLFIAALYTPGPNFVDRDKIIFRTAGSGATQPADHIAKRTCLVGFSSYVAAIWCRQIKPEFMRESS